MFCNQVRREGNVMNFEQALEIALRERPDLAACLKEPETMEIFREAAALFENMPKERLKVLRDQIHMMRMEREKAPDPGQSAPVP